jgi:hypothetical protein
MDDPMDPKPIQIPAEIMATYCRIPASGAAGRKMSSNDTNKAKIRGV